MLERFKKHIENKLPFLSKGKILVACSGGLDSVVLAHLCYKLQLEFALAHCNFKLRGDESDGDQQFVEELGKRIDVQVFTRTFDTLGYINKKGGSVQMAARDLRYAWFQELQKNKNFDFLLTAHHADDSLETFLINLSRGAGIDGLSGIPEQNGNIIRPLLPFSRKELLAFAKEQDLQWREDSSNAETKYLRNKIRHEVVPLLKELHPAFLKNFQSTQSHLHQTQVWLEEQIKIIKQKLFIEYDNIIKIKIEELKEIQPITSSLYFLFSEYGFTEIENLKDLLKAPSGKFLASKTHRLVKDRNYLLLSENGEVVSEHHQIGEAQTVVHDPFQMKIETVDTLENPSKNTIYVDKETLNYPLLIRKWQNGDYFYPFGMKRKKKVAKFFKDEKVDILSKEKQWLLCSGDEIVWVIGRRADDRFKVTRETKNILKLTIV
ncbi:tRNA lysidine(34) synthetase TilS [Allomuricauda sp. d1]|uniref:tRNA lysidine(34) synthetase TilS n=1 Tax=Allomuricauda sp. d1 TaxID=3136725 RepID=UPI0031DA857E